MQHHLMDEYRIAVNPVVVNSDCSIPASFELASLNCAMGQIRLQTLATPITRCKKVVEVIDYAAGNRRIDLLHPGIHHRMGETVLYAFRGETESASTMAILFVVVSAVAYLRWKVARFAGRTLVSTRAG